MFLTRGWFKNKREWDCNLKSIHRTKAILEAHKNLIKGLWFYLSRVCVTFKEKHICNYIPKMSISKVLLLSVSKGENRGHQPGRRQFLKL